MSIPNIDTFEHDISEEIKTKEATITDIASASGEVGNLPSSRARTSSMLLVLGIILILAVIATGVWLLFFYKTSPAANTAQTTEGNTLPDTSNRLLALSPALYDALGGNIGKVTKSEYGYVMELVSYSPVFSYMIKNESSYADELALAIGSPREAGTTTLPFLFTDTTLNNQNMRVGTSGSSTLVYAFVNTKFLVVSSSTSGILALRSAILAK